ncbi:MAG: ABC transporter ATP-binding protein, partial [Caldilineaceae bacterium]
MITIQNLTKQYNRDVYALRGVDMEIGAGMFGLIGPNGAGKTTLMRLIAGLLRPSSGHITLFGHDLASTKGKLAAKAGLGYLPQEFGFYPELTAVQFLDYIAILKGIRSRAERRRQVETVLEQVHLTPQAGRKLKQFSGGMKRRVGIAQALLGQPRLLIVDEPTAGLDPEERVRLRNLLAETAVRCTVILSTHIVEDISQSCNDLAVLHEGRVLFRGSPRDLIAAARGRVWTVRVNGEQSVGERSFPQATIVSTLQLQDGVQYRILGQPASGSAAMPTEP